MALTKTNSIREFVSQSGVRYEVFQKLLATGEAEFTDWDIQSNAERRIKAICSHKQAHGNATTRYVMLYNVDQNPAFPILWSR